jgi:hypothetical protein
VLVVIFPDNKAHKEEEEQEQDEEDAHNKLAIPLSHTIRFGLSLVLSVVVVAFCLDLPQ